jgi:putative aldouronate transport system permease protein
MKKSNAYKVFQYFNAIFMLGVVFITFYPFLYVLSVSFSSPSAVLTSKVTLFPVDLNFDAYYLVMMQKQFWIGYGNTLLYSASGTLLGLFMTVFCAYPLSKKNLKGRKVLLWLMVFTMYFGGGLIPSYLLIVKLKWIDTIWAIIVPGAISTFYMLVMKAFFEGIPQSLEEAAQLDGYNYFQILRRVVIPLSKPVLAAMTLFYAVGYWNEWFSALIYLNDEAKYPVTLFLRSLVKGTRLMGIGSSSQFLVNGARNAPIPQTMQSATIMLVAIPIVCIYPFVQKYFVHGVMIGSIKE